MMVKNTPRVLKWLASWMVALAPIFGVSDTARAFSANRVFFELTHFGKYRVTVNYTVPALREFREVRTDFSTRREAEDFYWKMVQGADFYLSDPKTVVFAKPPLQPRPW